MYQIRFDPEHRIVHVALQGMLDRRRACEVRRGRARDGDPRSPAVRRHRRLRRPARTSRPARRTQRPHHDPDIQGRPDERGPMAFVVGFMLGKMQADRVLGGPTSRVFLDHGEAQDWLRACWIDQAFVVTDHIRRSVQ
ncbi:hypothetical protein AB5I41_19375 [Sphingomonas sp. MMS24-JH45]